MKTSNARTVATGFERSAALDAALVLIRSGVPVTAAWHQTGDQFGTTRRSLMRWFRQVHGRPRDEWPAILESRYKGREAKPILPKAWALFLTAYESGHPPCSLAAYQVVRAEAEKCGWVVPGEATFRRKLAATGARRNRFVERYL